MHELTALSRLALLQYRWVLIVLLIAAACGPLIAAVLLVTRGTPLEDSLAAFAGLALMPGLLAGAILFGFNHGGNLVGPQSDCSHWLLRSPVPSWKIAAVPVVMKTLWISLFWGLFAAAFIPAADHPLPLLAPCLFLSSAAVWLTVISWMPLRAGWHRIVWLMVLFASLYVTMGLLVNVPYLRDASWRSVATVAGLGLSIVLYAASVWAAVRAVDLARSEPQGRIRADARRRPSRAQAGGALPNRHFVTPLRALAWHEFSRTSHWLIRTLLLAVIPAILLFGLLSPLHIASIVGVFLVFAYLAGFAVSGNAETPRQSGRSTLPPYLLASPLSAASIAWTRLLVPLGVVIGIFSCIVLVFALWAAWPTNREVWLQWAAGQAVALQGGASVMVTGIRLSIAITLATATVLIGRIIAMWWINMAGRTWFTVLMAIVFLSFYFIPLLVFLFWFVEQTQWSEVRARARSAAESMAGAVALLLALKFVAVLCAAMLLMRTGLATGTAIASFVGAWAAVVLMISVALVLLLPYSQATLPWCIALTALAIPLARLLIMPRMLAWNRHR